jgi:hypothetical protein
MNYLKQALVGMAVLTAVPALTAQTPAQLHAWMAPLPEWTLAEETEVFDPDNLFDRINGAAPLCIENNLVEMTAMEYRKGADYITLQAYRHATPQDAFGMYASERSDELKHFPIGGEAQGDDKSLFFFAGSVYVKMWSSASSDAADVLRTAGKALADHIDAHASYPPVAKAFPEKGKRPYSESYITKGYIGHEFLQAVYAAKYEADGQTFQLFVIDGQTPDGVRRTLESYLKFAGQPAVTDPSSFVINDRYNGDIPFRLQGQYLIGVYSENGDTVKNAADLLNETAKRLE